MGNNFAAVTSREEEKRSGRRVSKMNFFCSVTYINKATPVKDLTLSRNVWHFLQRGEKRGGEEKRGGSKLNFFL
jgi:hypothetical protein